MAETYLITGGAGNLACQLTFQLATQNRHIVLLDRADRPAELVSEGCEFVRGDLTSPEDIRSALDKYRPTVVIHFASLLSGNSEVDRPLAWRVNMDGTFNLLEESLRHDVKTFFFPSSVAAYGGSLPKTVPDDFPQWPDGLYGVTKMAVERLGHYYHVKHGLDFRCLRLPVVVSRHAPASAASAYASRAFVETASQGRFRFRVRPTTCPSLIYVRDVLRAIVMLLSAPAERLTQRVYSIQSMSPTAHEIAAAVISRWNSADIDFEVDSIVADLIESWPQELDDTASRRDWGWSPQFDLEAMADDLYSELNSEPME
ncbi:MAG: NAD-dependent epimerase/dehydratase family protein [Planctomycetota bacterium]|nr:NAD-dependent epimerase/dehydratase family protein [Planctomycetota bacterium]